MRPRPTTRGGDEDAQRTPRPAKGGPKAHIGSEGELWPVNLWLGAGGAILGR